LLLVANFVAGGTRRAFAPVYVSRRFGHYSVARPTTSRWISDFVFLVAVGVLSFRGSMSESRVGQPSGSRTIWTVHDEAPPCRAVFGSCTTRSEFRHAAMEMGSVGRCTFRGYIMVRVSVAMSRSRRPSPKIARSQGRTCSSSFRWHPQSLGYHRTLFVKAPHPWLLTAMSGGSR
jgi:hypothetical protein